MADYIYLLENRLSTAQKQALTVVRDVARAKGLTLFLVGGAVRDLTSGSPVRDLDVAVQGNALKLRKEFELAGGVVSGTQDSAQTLHMVFPGGVRVEVGSTMSATYPKPGKPVLKAGTILEDLRRRDFTANAMALSLNEGSYGLLMDPLNGVADIENRELRLASNYGFIEEPVRLVRATRFSARLGWTLEEKTQGRYETGKRDGYISTLNEFHRGYEAEEIVHEEDPLRVMRRLEAEGWMQVIAPAWGSAKANVVELEKVRDSQTQMQLQGVHPDASVVNFPLLTAKMGAKEIEALKKSFPRQGFVAEIEALESQAKEFATQLGSKAMAQSSSSYRLIHSAKPEAVLQVAYTTKSGTLQAKFKSFFGEWPQARQRIPLALMTEMRITAELPGYEELVEKLFYELMDGNLSTVEEMRAFLEPYSPPAPPPPVHLRRPRAARKDAKKGRSKKGATLVVDDGDDSDDEDVDDVPADVDADIEDESEDEIEGLAAGRAAFQADVEHEVETSADEDEDDEEEDGGDDATPEPTPRGRGTASGREPVKARTGTKTSVSGTPAAADTEDELDQGPGEIAPTKKTGGTAAKAAPVKGAGAKAVDAGATTAAKAHTTKNPAPEGEGRAAKSTPVKATATKATPVKAIAAKAIAVKAVPAKVVKEMEAKRAATTGRAVPAEAPAGSAKSNKPGAKRSR